MDPAIVSVFGQPPHEVDISETHVRGNDAAVITLLCMATVAVLLRFVARVSTQNPLKIDDWAIVVALLFIGGTAGLSIAGGAFGAGTHVWALTLPDVTFIFKILYAYTYIYASACATTKISILFFYCRVFSPLNMYLKWAIPFGFFITISYPIIIWVTMANCCKPVHYYWTQFSGAMGTCIDINTFFLALGIINMLNDFVVLLIPFPRIIKLQMNKRKKIAICGILAVGCFVCVASIVRIYYLYQFMSAIDVTWLMGPVFIWSTIEPAIAIVCACLPHLAPLCRLVYRSGLSSYGRNKTSSGSSTTPWRPWNGPRVGSRPEGRALFFSNADDEIGLTSTAMAKDSLRKHNSNESTLDGNPQSQCIHVQSSFVQTASKDC
ncbi:pth11-like integral membrane protein [Aspergillus ambiguus]|uniref:pth11-like integral membrane protein n=1 Tax=Aspergillus ambiguus TaxID=176160 RepID=UPI003CCD4433